METSASFADAMPHSERLITANRRRMAEEMRIDGTRELVGPVQRPANY
jgi:hypothetical protein